MDVCVRCKKEFEKYQWNQKNCYDCLEETDPRFKGRPKKDCLWCKTEFQPRVIRQQHCSEECGEMTRQHNYFLREYGVPREKVYEMFDDCGHRCNICGSEGFIMNTSRHTNKLVVDHCHSTDEVRGILCHNCNRALGLLQDDLRILGNCIDYLTSGLVSDNLERGMEMSKFLAPTGWKDEPYDEDLE